MMGKKTEISMGKRGNVHKCFMGKRAYLILVREYRCFFMQIGVESFDKTFFKFVKNSTGYEGILQLLTKNFYFRQPKVPTLIKNAHLLVTSVFVVVF